MYKDKTSHAISNAYMMFEMSVNEHKTMSPTNAHHCATVVTQPSK